MSSPDAKGILSDRQLREGIEISIPLYFNGLQPNAYGAELATARPLQAENFIASVSRGGYLNCEQYSLTTHCNGTHTESIAHLLSDAIPICDVLGLDLTFNAKLISVTPETTTVEHYLPTIEADDRLITRQQLEDALNSEATTSALIIRTQPNDQTKCSRNYSIQAAPFFTNEAMQFIVERKVRHLLVDLPSVDRAADQGLLSNHRIFWNVLPGVRELTSGERRDATITEMVYVPESIKDGNYLVAIQIPHFKTDAAPSRIILYPSLP
ncbi:cyclase family protein [bacterium]|nr:cyclase family protein [bacterium]